MIHRNCFLFFFVGLFLFVSLPALAIDTLQVTTPDPILVEENWTKFDRSSGFVGKSNLWIYEDRDGNMGFAGEDGGAQKYDGLTWTRYLKTDGLAHDNVSQITQMQDGTMLIATYGPDGSAAIHQLIEKDDQGKTQIKTDTFEGWRIVQSLLAAADGSVWANLRNNSGDEHSLWHFIKGKWETVHPPVQSSGSIRCRRVYINIHQWG